MSDKKPEFDVIAKGLRFQAWHHDNMRDATIKISLDGKPVKEFVMPAYKIWNIAAHAGDIADDINDGLRLALSTGLGGSVGIQETTHE